MYYDQSTEAQSTAANGLNVGPLHITPQQVICINFLEIFELNLIFRLELVLLLN
jgi:hypothetical protein